MTNITIVKGKKGAGMSILATQMAQLFPRVLYVCPLAHLPGHPPFECTKETRIMKEHGVDIELLTFCGVHSGFEVSVPHIKVMKDNELFKAIRKKFVLQWFLRVPEYLSTITKAELIAGNRPIYLRDAEPLPHLVHITNIIARKKWVISSTGGLYTTGKGIKRIYKFLLGLTGVYLRFWYKIGRDKISYSVQNPHIKLLMQEILGKNITTIPLGHKAEIPTNKEEARGILGIGVDKRVLLMLGANHSGRDNETVYKALQNLDDGIMLIHAGPTIIGYGISPVELAKKYNVEAKVMVLEKQIGNEEKKLLFGAADWAILSYRDTFSSTTSMLWEAAAFNTPVIASSGSELETLVEHWALGLVFKAGSPDSLIETIRKSNKLDGWAQENCREFIEFYSEEKWFQATIALLK